MAVFFLPILGFGEKKCEPEIDTWIHSVQLFSSKMNGIPTLFTLYILYILL